MTYSPLDIRMIEIFGKNELTEGIIGNIPHFEDIFRIAKEKGITVKVRQSTEKHMPDYLSVFGQGIQSINFSYDLSSEPLAQSEDRKQMLVDLFS